MNVKVKRAYNLFKLLMCAFVHVRRQTEKTDRKMVNLPHENKEMKSPRENSTSRKIGMCYFFASAPLRMRTKNGKTVITEIEIMIEI